MKPLHAGPAVGFEQPFEMLKACHERVQQRLALLGRLDAHLAKHGADLNARDAASDLLRYFDLAAPLHHQDEELHVLPRLREIGQGALADRLLQEHGLLHAGWQRLREPLLRVQAGETVPLGAWQDWQQLYGAHIQAEESLVFEPIRDSLDDGLLAAMATEMAGRRQAKP